MDAIEAYKFQGTSAKVNFALDAPPRYPALGNRTDMFQGMINIAPSIDYLEQAFDDAEGGTFSRRHMPELMHWLILMPQIHLIPPSE